MICYGVRFFLIGVIGAVWVLVFLPAGGGWSEKDFPFIREEGVELTKDNVEGRLEDREDSDLRSRISKERFEKLEGIALLELLNDKAIQLSRRQSDKKKREVYDLLTEGQQSLFTLFLVYGHTQGGWYPFYEAGYDRYLPEITEGIKRIEDEEMVRLLKKVEGIFKEWSSRKAGRGAWGEDERERRGIVAPIDKETTKALKKTIKIMEIYVRERPLEFVVFDEKP